MDVNDILKLAPIDDIADKFGVTPDVARQAVKEGSATLIGGLQKSAETESGSAAIDKALSKHGGFAGASKVDDIDQADGEKIVTHILGDKKNEVAEKLTNEPKTAGLDFGKLLPILAPIVMGLIANGRKSSGSNDSSGGIGDLIGGLLGGGNSGGNSGGIDIGGLLGGLFGKK